MSPRFLRAVEITLRHEGGLVNDPADAGGLTNWGISQRSYPSVDIRNLTREGAKEIYHRDFWMPFPYERFDSCDIAAKTFDLGVNMGSRQAHILLQRATRAAMQNNGVRGPTIADDGIIGPITLSAVNNAVSRELLAALKAEAAGFYRRLVTANATQQRFLNGWLNRAYS